MASANRWKEMVVGIAAAAATALMLWFGNGLDPWWPLMWFAPLPVLVFALRSSWWAAGLAAGAAWLVAGLNMWAYFHAVGMPFAVWLGIFGVVAAFAAAAVLLFRVLVLRGALWSGLIAFPSVWVVLEYVRNLTTPHGTAGSVAYTQLKFLPFLQLASITGPWGMSFVLLLFPAALAIGLHLRSGEPRRAFRMVAVTFGALAAVLIYGAIRLVTAPRGPLVRVGLIASDLPSNDGVAAEGAETERLFQNYATEAEQLAAGGAQIVVLPEKLGVVLDAENGKADPIFQRLADRTGATIVVGEVHVSPLAKDGPAKYNQARVYQPHAEVLSYDKEHMLPPFESPLTPGTALVILPKQPAPWGVAICKDMDFARPARRYGMANVGLMLVPAWDFNRDRSWHGHIAVMRGVEDGFSMVRAAKNGFLTVSDDRGRVVAEARSDAAPFATLVASVPAVHSATLYLLLGDWFAWLVCVLLVFSVVQLCRVATRSSISPDRVGTAVAAK
jgi:apolipoprotein N-acyltransferase